MFVCVSNSIAAPTEITDVSPYWVTLDLNGYLSFEYQMEGGTVTGGWPQLFVKDTAAPHFEYFKESCHIDRPLTLFELTDHTEPAMQGTKTIKFSLQSYGSTGQKVWIDNIKTAPAAVPAPSAAILGTLGCGLVGWFRKRRAI